MATEAIVPDLGLEIEQPVETEVSGEHEPSSQEQRRQEDRAYREYIKRLREDGDSGKFARRIKDDISRYDAVRRLDPKGIDGIRDRLGLIDSLAHGDKKGTEALSAIQESLAESQTVLEALAQGDAESFDSLGQDHQEGLMRLAPTILDRLSESSPEQYVSTMLPHFVGALRESELATSYNAMVNLLKEQPPTWLTNEQKGQWAADRMAKVTEQARLMGAWFKAQEDRLKELGKETRQPGERREPISPKGSMTPETQAHWKTSIYPQTDAHATEQFTSLLKPWEQRLAQAGVRLSEQKKNALLKEFVGEVVAKANANQDYKRQMGRYNVQRRPDAGTVVSTFKGEFNRHASKAMETLIRRDYGQMLEKKGTGKTAQTTKPGAKVIPPTPGVKVVSVKPRRENIDFPKTPADWIYKNKWRLKDGSVVQLRP